MCAISRNSAVCEGWTADFDWLREAQLNLAFNWLPAYTTLKAPKAFSKMAPMGATGLVSEAAKYDETAKSKCFSRNFDSGASFLSAQTDAQHCVSTVVANCTKNGWAMWRIFLDHSGTQVGHESKIAEVGFCKGWCDWLREAQVDHEVDWPSACTTLKALSKVAPLLPVRHEITRRIMNRPVISKAAESERLKASKVAVDLGVQCYFAQRRANRCGPDGAVAIVVVGPCGRFPMWREG